MKLRNIHLPLLVIITVMALLSGCTSAKDDSAEGGLAFVNVKDYSRDNYLTISDEQISELADGYVCVVGNGAPGDLVIPDEYNGSPVYILTSDDGADSSQRFSSVEIGSNVRYILSFANHDECADIPALALPSGIIGIKNSLSGMRAVNTLTIPEDVSRIDSSFERMSNADVIVAGAPQFVACFYDSESVNIMISNDDLYSDIATGFSDSSEHLSGITLGTEDFINYSQMADEQGILDMGATHFCEALAPDKEITPEQAGEYARFLDGPVVSVECCPAIPYSKYLEQDREELLNGSGLVCFSISDVARYMPGRYYPADTSKAPDVYFIVEKTGGESVEYTNGTYYHMHYRISVRSIEDDGLICWFTTSEGEAPATNPPFFTEGDRKYLKGEHNSISSPQYVVLKYFNIGD